MRLLDQVSIASPCPANWDDMKGDDQVRHCSLCRLMVYNLSEMTPEEAEDLLTNHQGRPCVRYYQRTDGKVMTKDCPRGLKAFRQRIAKRLALAASFFAISLGCGQRADEEPITGKLIPPSRSVKPTSKLDDPGLKNVSLPDLRMGEVAVDHPSAKLDSR